MPTRTTSHPRVIRAKALRAPIPPSPDPFVNTPLIALGPDENGKDRFWTSTWNANVGSLAVLVNEDGDSRVYRFPSKGDWTRGGFYSAAQEDSDTLWLCGNLSRVERLSLKSGKTEAYDTGAPKALNFQGMILDHESGKLFAAAFPPPRTIGFSFDFRRRKPVKVHDLDTHDHYARSSFPNGDGTWTLLLNCPGETLARWDPRDETVTLHQYAPTLNTNDMSGGTVYRVITDDRGRAYISTPGCGWYDGRKGRFDDHGPKPKREMTWFARQGGHAWGAVLESGDVFVGRWDLATGEVKHICRPGAAHLMNVNLTRSGKIVCVGLYGEFTRFDAHTGALEVCKQLPTLSWGTTDCIQRIDRDRVVGTPFITQRFWEVNFKTKEGQDCGRAAPGFGEVLLTWKIGGKVYMAAYTDGELMEYDPSRPARFPENPRVVADPPGGMRPVGKAGDGRRIFYSCSNAYGNLGSKLTRYDTKTGIATYAPDPLPDQQIFSLFYDRASKSLIAGTSRHSDCQSCPPTMERSMIAQIDPETLEVTRKIEAPAGADFVGVRGPLGNGKFLCALDGSFGDGPRWFAFDLKNWEIPEPSALRRFPDGFNHLIWAGVPGYFVFSRNGAIELWDMRKEEALAVLHKGPGRLIAVEEDCVYLVTRKEVFALEGCLKGLMKK